MHKKFRFVGWLAVGGLLAASLIAPAGASAADTKGQWPDETASAPVETESAPVETRSAPVETESAPVETRSAPVETESAPVETASLPAETGSIAVETETPSVTPCADCAPSSHSVPSGRVDAETGTPNEGVTPPATDTINPTNTPSNDGWQLVLVALAALLATALILTPASRKTRR